MRTFKITTVNPSGIDYGAPAVTAFVRALEAFHAKVPLTSMTVATTVTPGVYSYTFVAQDGRHWNQTFDFGTGSPTSDPSMTFNVGTGWKLSEFANHRAVRDAVVSLVTVAGVTGITYLFT